MDMENLSLKRELMIGSKKKLKIAITTAIIITAGCYVIKRNSYDVTVLYPVNVTQSTSLRQQHGYKADRTVHKSAQRNKSFSIDARPLSPPSSYGSVTDVTREITTYITEEQTGTERTSQIVTDVTVDISGSSPHRRTSFSNRTVIYTERIKIGKMLLKENFDSSVNKNSFYDIMNMKAIKFDLAYKNPCWKGTKGNGPLAERRLYCVPHFYVIGVKKSGTTDLYTRVLRHPEVCSPGFKESQWMARLRFGNGAPLLRFPQIHDVLRNGPNVRSVEFYVSMFDRATKCIQSQPRTHSQHYDFITGDATPSLLHMHTQWEMLPGNEGLDEPRYTNFHYVNHLTPQAKLIVLFREPVSRLYSDFHHIMKHTEMDNAPDLFHNHVTKLVNAYTDCLSEYSLRRCIYNNTLHNTLKQDGINLAESFHAGFYAFFMKELLSVFQRDQLLPLLMLDYKNDMKATLQTTFRFLGLGPLNTKAMEKILKIQVQNSGKSRKSISGDMLEKTKTLLKQFYKPYNEEMARLMGDERYLFDTA